MTYSNQHGPMVVWHFNLLNERFHAELTGSRLTVDTKTINKLIDASFAAKLNAYCPYSRFPVGAALLCSDGPIFTGS